MTVDEVRERLAAARATVVLYDEVLRIAVAEGAPDRELRRLRASLSSADTAVQVAEGELIFAEGMD